MLDILFHAPQAAKPGNGAFRSTGFQPVPAGKGMG